MGLRGVCVCVCVVCGVVCAWCVRGVWGAVWCARYGVLCVVCCGVVSVVSVCGAAWHAESPRVQVQNVSVCTFETLPCVPAKRAHAFTNWKECCHVRDGSPSLLSFSSPLQKDQICNYKKMSRGGFFHYGLN